MGEVHLTSNRTLFIAVFALVAAPILAGCAENDTNNNTPTTGTPPTGTTPAGGTPPTTTTPASPTVIPSLPATPPQQLQLKMGAMMPISGPLSNLGPDMRDGARLAVDEINELSAQTGLSVTLQVEDDKTTDTAGAPTTFQRLVSGGATAVVGPCCSGVTGAVLQAAVDNEVVVASPSATSPALTQRENEGFFWRVSPSDELQGRVLAKLVQEDGVKKVNVIAINNAYGTGLANVFRQTYTGNAGSTIGNTQTFNENAEEFASVVTAACGGTPEAIVVIAYIAQGGNILKEMNKQGCLGRVKVYGPEGLYDGEGNKGVAQSAGQDQGGKWLAAGVKGTKPDSGNLSDFNTKFNAKYGHAPAQYSAESYDGVMYMALAALMAKSVDGPDIAANLLKVSNGGVKCREYRTCAAFILAGQDIDYQGQAHDFDYSDKHEPTKGIYAVWSVDESGNVKTVQTGRIAE